MSFCSRLTNCCRKNESYLSDKSGEKIASCIICYSRTDQFFTDNLYNALIDAGERVIQYDREAFDHIDKTLETLRKQIESYDVFIFILSPASIQSEICNWEIDQAVKNGKRIIPCVRKDVNYRKVRAEIATLNWIFMRDNNENPDDFESALNLLLKTLDQDVKHAKFHTDILVRAIKWELNDFDKSLLFTGQDLVLAENWRSASALGKEPKPTTLHLSFIHASATLSQTMRKRQIIAVFFAFIVAIGIVWPSWGVFFFALVFSHFFVYFASSS